MKRLSLILGLFLIFCSTGCNEDWWSYHIAYKNTHDKTIVFSGDSITFALATDGADALSYYFPDTNIGAFGIPGDTLFFLNYRINNNELKNANPDIVIINIGTNNIGFLLTPEQMAAEIIDIALLTRVKQPFAKVGIMEIFPRGEDNTSYSRILTNEVNQILRTYFENGFYYNDTEITLHSINAGLITGDTGTLLDGYFKDDHLHLNLPSYMVWMQHIKDYYQL